MKARILVVEDEREMAELIRMYLENEGASVTTCETGEDAGDVVERGNDFDLVILDINLPGMDGFEFLQKLRRKSQVPAIIVSARETDEDIIMGLGIGADEFVVKPFSPKVLVARVRALLRRMHNTDKGDDSKVFNFGPYSLNIDAYTLTKGNERIPLSVKEFEVLKYLVENMNKACSPDDIYASVWKNRYGDITAVAVYIQRLRRKIEEDPGNPRFIKTLHGKGYIFKAV